MGNPSSRRGFFLDKYYRRMRGPAPQGCSNAPAKWQNRDAGVMLEIGDQVKLKTGHEERINIQLAVDRLDAPLPIHTPVMDKGIKTGSHATCQKNHRSSNLMIVCVCLRTRWHRLGHCESAFSDSEVPALTGVFTSFHLFHSDVNM